MITNAVVGPKKGVQTSNVYKRAPKSCLILKSVKCKENVGKLSTYIYINDEFLLYKYDETTILFPYTQNPYVQIEKKN